MHFFHRRSDEDRNQQLDNKSTAAAADAVVHIYEDQYCYNDNDNRDEISFSVLVQGVRMSYPDVAAVAAFYRRHDSQ